MSITSSEEMAGMRAAGAVVHRMLEAMKKEIRPGVTSAELDEVGAQVTRKHDARSAPALVYRFPGVSFISVNEEAVHGTCGALQHNAVFSDEANDIQAHANSSATSDPTFGAGSIFFGLALTTVWSF